MNVSGMPGSGLRSSKLGKSFDRGVGPVKIVDVDDVCLIESQIRKSAIRPGKQRKPPFGERVQPGVVQPAQ